MKPKILRAVRILTPVVALLLSLAVAAQGTITARPNISSSSYSNGYYEFLPDGYNSNSNNYPLIIYLNGHSAVGTGTSEAELQKTLTGPFYYLAQGWFPNRQSLNSFVMITPQWLGLDVQPIHVNEVINFALANYRIDPNRIYLTGISSGGGVTFNYVGANSTYANRIAAIVPFAPSTEPPLSVTGPTPAKGRTIAEANVAVYAFHYKEDPGVDFYITTDKWIEYINNPTPPNPPADSTTPTGTAAHDIWSNVYYGMNNFWPGGYDATLNGLNVFQWMLQFSRSGGSVLPVRFAAFNAQCNAGRIVLQWKTAAEQNSRNFTVEKSTDGASWNTIGSVNAAGNSSTEKSYTLTDAVGGANVYYRVVAVDNDERKTISPVVRTGCNSDNRFSVFPNPVKNRTTVNVDLLQPAKVKLQVHNSKGALIYQNETQAQRGTTQLPVDLSAAPQGMYILTVEWNGQRQTVKLIKE